MPKAEDEPQARLERAREIGLFRYMLIREAADATLTGRQRGALVRKLAAGPHTDPDGRTSGSPAGRWTGGSWTGARAGSTRWCPSPRQSQPRTPPEVFELATALKKENPSRSAAQIRRILQAQHGWAPDETTLQRMFVRTGLTALRAPAEPAVFGRFEAGRPNEIWTGDALHGPRISGRKTYLFAFLDDHSRAVAGHRWGFAEDTVRPGRRAAPGAGGARGSRIRLRRQRIGVRRLVADAGLRQTRHQAGPLRPRPAAGQREDRAVLPHREQRVHRRDRRR